MNGHIRKRGQGWVFVVDLGRQPARACADCRRRHWIELVGTGPSKCPKCGGSLGPVRIDRRQRWSPQYLTKAEAARQLRKVLGVIDSGGDPFPDTVTVRDFSARWIDHKAGTTRPNTVARYRTLLRLHVLPVLGSMRVDRVKVGHIQRVLDATSDKGLAPRTVHHVRAVMSGMFSTAVAWEMIPANPVSAIEGATVPRPDLEVPSAEQVLALFDAAKGSVWSIPLLLAISTGARRSEVLGLGWDQVSLETDPARIQVVRNLQRVPGDGLRFFDPKTQRSRRSIALPGFAVPILRSHKAAQAVRRLKGGEAWTDLDLVCERGDGQPLDPDSFTHATKRLARKAGLHPATRLHDARHSLATTLLEEGIDAAVVSAVLGHSSPGFTASVYQHVTDGLTEQAAAAIERRFAR